MMVPKFTLAVVSTLDGFIARAADHAPQDWASAEEQALFFAQVEAADWSIMGRHTHQAADRPNRRRIILSTGAGGWRRPTQLWLDPGDVRQGGIAPRDLMGEVAQVYPLRQGLILGGTRVHDWFHDHGAIDEIKLTVEPLRFGAGLTIFSTGGAGRDPVETLVKAGYDVASDDLLNDAGTRFLVLHPRRASS